MADNFQEKMAAQDLSDDQIASLSSYLMPSTPEPVQSREPIDYGGSLDLTNDQIMSGDFEQLEQQAQEQSLSYPEPQLQPVSPYQVTGDQIDPTLVNIQTPQEKDFTEEQQLANAGLARQQSSQNDLFERLSDVKKAEYEIDTRAEEKRAVVDQRAREDQIRSQNREDDLMQQRHEQTKDHYQKVDQMTDELSKTKIDSNRFWSDMSTGKKIFTMIAMVASDFQHSKSGGRGASWMDQHLDREIQKDIAAQKSDYNAKSKAISSKESAYSRAMAVLGNDKEAEVAARNAGLSLAQNEMANIAASTKNPKKKLELEQAIIGIDAKKQAHLAKSQQAYMENMSSVQEMQVPGTNIIAANKESRERLQKGLQGIDVSNHGITRMKELLKSVSLGTKIAPNKIAAELDTLAKLLRGNMRLELIGPGAITEKEMEILKQTIPSGLESLKPWHVKQTVARLDTILKKLSTGKKYLIKYNAASGAPVGLKTMKKVSK